MSTIQFVLGYIFSSAISPYKDHAKLNQRETCEWHKATPPTLITTTTATAH